MMSSNLYWRPHQLDKARVDLGKQDDTLKITLRKEYGYPLDVILTKSDIGMLHGMAIMGCKDAEKAIEHIKKYDEIHIFEEN
jgi:hypothetical protein